MLKLKSCCSHIVWLFSSCILYGSTWWRQPLLSGFTTMQTLHKQGPNTLETLGQAYYTAEDTCRESPSSSQETRMSDIPRCLVKSQRYCHGASHPAQGTIQWSHH